MKETTKKNVIMQKCELSRICFILYLPRLPKLNEIYCGIAQNSFEEKLAFAPQIHNFFKCLWDCLEWIKQTRILYLHSSSVQLSCVFLLCLAIL